MRAAVRTSLDTHDDDLRLLQVLAEQGPRSPEIERRIAEHHRARVAALHELLEAHSEVRVADTDTAARLMVTTLEQAVHHLVAARWISSTWRTAPSRC